MPCYSYRIHRPCISRVQLAVLNHANSVYVFFYLLHPKVMPSFNKVVCAGLAGIFACGSINMPAQALTKAETMSLSYGQVKGSGLANRCPSVVGEQTIALSSGKQYKITDLCIEPKSWQVSRHFSRPLLTNQQIRTIHVASNDLNTKISQLTPRIVTLK